MKGKIYAIFLMAMVLAFAAVGVSAQDEKAKTVNGGVVNEKAVSLPLPEYPAAAKAVNARGAVQVEVLIDETGSVVSAQTIAGHALLRDASEKAARQAKFKPTTLSGKAVKVIGVLVYNFSGNSQGGVDTGIIVNGRAVSLVQPDYPVEAREARAEGAVNVRVLIDETGNVVEAEAISGNELLYKASEEAALKSKFSATEIKGKAVKVTGVIVYNFAVGNNTATAGDSKTENPGKQSIIFVDGGVLNGKAIELPLPETPPAARAVGAKGAVYVKVTVNEKGKVIQSEAVSGHALLRQAAEKAAFGAKFSPTFISGEPAMITGIIVYNFASPAKP